MLRKVVWWPIEPSTTITNIRTRNASVTLFLEPKCRVFGWGRVPLDIEKCIVNDWEHGWDTQYTPDLVIGHKSIKILFLVPKLSVLTIFKKNR